MVSPVQATQLYGQAIDRASNSPKTEAAANFKDMVEVNFNKFAKMSQTEILQHISAASATLSTASTSTEASPIASLRASLRKQEIATQNLVAGTGSSLELVTAATEAQNTLQVMVTLRDKITEGFNQLLNMQI